MRAVLPSFTIKRHGQVSKSGLYANVSMKFISQLENGKSGLRLDKVNDVLRVFGYQLGPMEIKNE